MTSIEIQYLAAALTILAVATGIISFDSRIKLSALGLQYAAVALLGSQVLSAEASIAKGAVGGAVVLGLLLTLLKVKSSIASAQESALPSSMGFRIVLAIFGIVAGLGLAGRGWMPIPEFGGAAAAAASILVVGGFIQVGLMQVGFGSGVGLLMAVSGFDLALSHVERSLAVAALFSLTHLGLGVASGYLEVHQSWSSQEPAENS